MIPQITVNAQQAYARFSPAGIPEQVRKNLRALLPGLGQRVGGQIESRLNTELKSRQSLTVSKLMIENPSALYLQITVKSSKNPMLPTWLESGTRPHEILGRPLLSFWWEKMGFQFIGPRVMHPGFAGIHYAENTLAAMESEIVDTLSNATKDL